MDLETTTASETTSDNSDSGLDDSSIDDAISRRYGDVSGEADTTTADVPDEMPSETPDDNATEVDDADDAQQQTRGEARYNDVQNRIRSGISDIRVLEAIKNRASESIRNELMNSFKNPFVDADGDVIDGVEGLMGIENPATGEAFTLTEAQAYYSFLKQQERDELQSIDKQAANLANLNVDLKYDAESILDKYANWIEANPDIMDKLDTMYKNTLQFSSDGSVVISQPSIPLVDFYETAILGYIEADKSRYQPTQQPTPTEVQLPKTSVDALDVSDISGDIIDDAVVADDDPMGEALVKRYGKDVVKTLRRK